MQIVLVSTNFIWHTMITMITRISNKQEQKK